MASLDYIRNSVQEVAEAISAIMAVDVTVVNTNLIRIAATGKYESLIGSKLPDGCLYDRIMKSESKEYLVERQKTSCIDCEVADSCEELATMGYPIYARDGKILGIIGLIAFDENARKFISENYENIKVFLDKLGLLLAGNLQYENTIVDMKLKNNEINNLINSLDLGIIMTDENGKILDINKVAGKFLNCERVDLLEKNIDDVFENIKNIKNNHNTVFPSISKLGNRRESFAVKFIENKVYGETKSRIYEITKYSNVLKNAYDILEKKEQVNFDQILGTSTAIVNTKSLAKQVALGDSSVMIRGESGTGKELFARAIHNNSSRKNNVFIAINCASIPENLLESELFGYEKGAFTGASNSGKIGKFELADGGTLFLDEIGDLPIHLQPKLLRVLQDGSFTRIGGTKKIKVNFRLISATNRNLEKMIETNEFRDDLYYRLNVIPIIIPSLRDRKEDIKIIAEEKLKIYSKKLNKGEKRFSDEILDVFDNYEWKGNIRELENIIEYLVNISDGDVIDVDLLPERFLSNDMKKEKKQKFNLEMSDEKTLKELTKDFEREVLEEYLRNYGDTTEAKEIISKKLDINISTLYRKLY